jgi:hypothetical protein
VTATAPTERGWLYLSGALTPYDLEMLYEQIATLGSVERGAVHVEIDLGGMPRTSPELRQLARRMKRLRRHGVRIHLHAARSHHRSQS